MKRIGLTLIAAIISGGLAGVITAVVTDQSLNEYAEDLMGNETFSVISQEKPRALPGTYEEAVAQVQETGWPAIAFVHAFSSDSLRSENWFTTQDAAGYGTVITSDGWVLFHKEAFKTFSDIDDIEVWTQGERYLATEMIFDEQTDSVLVKINADGLPTLAFGPSNDMAGGDLLFVIASATQIIPTSLKNAHEPSNGLIMPVESYITQWTLTNAVDTPSPILNAGGELVGFTNEDSTATPLHHFQPFIQSTLRHGEVQYAGLGVYTVSIDRVLNMDASVTDQAKFGALVVSPRGVLPGVVPNGPADEAGVLQGDIIVAINDTFLQADNSLAELLAGYEPGQEVVVTVMRNGERLDLDTGLIDIEEIDYPI